MSAYDKNFERLNNLIGLYESLTVNNLGRRSAKQLDLLRATVVLIHSTLEDLLRSIQAWKLPMVADQEQLNRISLAGTNNKGRAAKFSMGELLNHRGKSVDELIETSIKEHLGYQSFNSSSDVVSALKSCGIEITLDIETLLPELNGMMERRHKIVHEADRVEILGRGNHRIRSISLEQVKRWKLQVDRLSVHIVKQLGYG